MQKCIYANVFFCNYPHSDAYIIDNNVDACFEGVYKYLVEQEEKRRSGTFYIIADEEAVEFLNDLIGEKGWAELKEIQALQEEYGISKGTLYNAKDELRLETVSRGYSKNKVTYWIASDVDKEKFLQEHQSENIKGLNPYL